MRGGEGSSLRGERIGLGGERVRVVDEGAPGARRLGMLEQRHDLGRRARTAARRALHANGSLSSDDWAAAPRGVWGLKRGVGRPGQGSGT